VLLMLIVVSSSLNLRPVIGILTQPFDNNHRTFISGGYVKWLESAGARIIVVPYDAPESTLKMLFDSMNGVLFTGGGLDLKLNTSYMKTLSYFYKTVLEANDKGDYFPIWGTCMGFQALSIITANDDTVLQTYAFDSYNLPLPLKFIMNPKQSRLFNSASDDVISSFTNKPVTMNLHHDGIDPSLYQGSNTALTNFYRLISTNVDRKGKLFGSTFESLKYPIYGTQWHPERNQFEWDVPEDLDHNDYSIRATQYLANFFVNEARKNNHSFKSLDELKKYIIYSFKPVFTGDDDDKYPEQITYVFDQF